MERAGREAGARIALHAAENIRSNVDDHSHSALEPIRQALSVRGPGDGPFLRGSAIARDPGIPTSMSTATQPVAGAAAQSANKPKPIPGWKHLSKLIPYIARCKGQVALGMVALAAMGIVGTLLPLTFGVIMDCLSGNAQPLGRLGQTSPELVRLIPAYHPSSARTLIIYCLAALVIVALKGVFSFWSRWILI